MTQYYQTKMELMELIGEKISFINKRLFEEENPTENELTEIADAIVFLKDHKYLLTSQGLNQLEFFIRESEEALQKLRIR